MRYTVGKIESPSYLKAFFEIWGKAYHLKVKELCETNYRKLAKALSEKPLFFVIDETELRGKNFLQILSGSLNKTECCFWLNSVLLMVRLIVKR